MKAMLPLKGEQQHCTPTNIEMEEDEDRIRISQDTIRCDAIRYNTIRYDTIR